MKIAHRVAVFAFALGLATSALAAPKPSHGPKHGYLIISGGMDYHIDLTVHGDQFVVNGPGRVAVWDGKEHDGKDYYYLHMGDHFNTVTRTATLAHAGTGS